MISRYEDIRAALTDPRLSANTLPDEHASEGCGQQHSGDLRAHRRSRAQPAASNDDEGLHLSASRGDASADPGIGRRIPGRDDRGGTARRSGSRIRAAGALTGDIPAARRALQGPRILPAEQHEGPRLAIDGRGEGGVDRRDVRLHVGAVRTQGTRTGRRLAEPADRRLRRHWPTQRCDRGHERRDSAAGRSRNHRQHDRAWNGDAVAAPRPIWPGCGRPTTPP